MLLFILLVLVGFWWFVCDVWLLALWVVVV